MVSFTVDKLDMLGAARSDFKRGRVLCLRKGPGVWAWRVVTHWASSRICTRPAPKAACALAIMFAEGTPVRTNDFSQSAVEGPRILPSM